MQRLWHAHFAAPLEKLQRETGRVFWSLIRALLVSLGVPVIALAAAAELYFQSPGLSERALWTMCGLLGLVAAAAIYIGFKRLMPPALNADERLKSEFFRQFCEPACALLRPGWRCVRDTSTDGVDVFASQLFKRIPVTRFTVQGRIEGTAARQPFVMHELIATGDRGGGQSGKFMLIVLHGFLARVSLAAAVPGHLRFCLVTDSPWRRPPLDGFVPADARVPALAGRYHVEATNDAVDPAALPGLVQLLQGFVERGYRVHVSIGGANAWIAIDRPESFFEPQLGTYSADHLKAVDYLFTTVELVASQLPHAGAR